MRKIVLLALLVLCRPSVAQLSAGEQLLAADWFHRSLAPGVDWYYYQFDKLFDSKQSISCIQADLSVSGVHIELPYKNGRQKLTSMIKSQVPNAAAAINGTFFRASGHATYLRVNGTEIPPVDKWSSYGYKAGLVFNRSTGAADIALRPKGKSGDPIKDWRSNAGTWTDAMVNGPLLLNKGKITSKEFPKGSHCNRNPRTMVGMKSDHVLLLVTADGRFSGDAAGLSCDEMAQVMLGLGCVNAVSLDGGGSTAMYGRGEPNEGLISYPSTNGGYDHDTKDERAVGNAIAITGSARVAMNYDARLESISDHSTINSGEFKTITLKYRNIGSQPWNAGRVSLTTSRPFWKASKFYESGSWTNTSTAWKMPFNQTVQPGQELVINFAIKGPVVSKAIKLKEYFQLTLDNTKRFGPADNELRLVTTVNPRQ